MSLSYERLLASAGMNEDHVGVPGLSQSDRLAGADRDDIDASSVVGFEGGEERIEQTRVVGAGCSGKPQDTLAVGALARTRDRKQYDDDEKSNSGRRGDSWRRYDGRA